MSELSKLIVTVAAGSLVLLSEVGLPSKVAANDTPDVIQMLQRFDDLWTASSSQGAMTMRVKTRRYQRTVSMQVWSKGTEKFLARITAPAKEKGTATLKVDDQMWNYLPKVDRTIKVPASMLSGSWMGSHFSNNDLVGAVRFSENYDCDITESSDSESYAQPVWIVSCVPHEDTPVVWGRVELVLAKSDELPIATRFYSERDELVRTMSYEDVRDLGGIRVPTLMRAVPADEPDEFTEMTYDDLKLNVEVPDRIFSLQSLKR